MTRTHPNITLRIDEIVSDQPGLDAAVLEAALRSEIGQVLATQGPSAFGSGSSRARMDAWMPQGFGSLGARVASTAVKAVTE